MPTFSNFSRDSDEVIGFPANMTGFISFQTSGIGRLTYIKNIAAHPYAWRSRGWYNM